MGKVIVTDTYLSNIASAIRGKAGTQSLYTPAQMASAITNLPSGVSVSALSVSANGTYSAPSGYAYDPVTVDVQGGGGGITADEIALRTISGAMTGSASLIGSYAFYMCNEITGANFPNATFVVTRAFGYCSNISYASFPNLISASVNAFVNCSALKTINMPNLTSCVGSGVFDKCTELESVSLPSLKSTNTHAFYYCSKLTDVYLPNVTSLGSYTFSGCSNLTNVYCPKVISVYATAFFGCSNLRSLSFPNLTAVYSSAFINCSKLESLYFLGSSVAGTVSANILWNTPMSASTYLGHYGSIYVRASLYQSWITKAYWSVYSARFVSMTDEEIAALDAQ